MTPKLIVLHHDDPECAAHRETRCLDLPVRMPNSLVVIVADRGCCEVLEVHIPGEGRIRPGDIDEGVDCVCEFITGQRPEPADRC